MNKYELSKLLSRSAQLFLMILVRRAKKAIAHGIYLEYQKMNKLFI